MEDNSLPDDEETQVELLQKENLKFKTQLKASQTNERTQADQIKALQAQLTQLKKNHELELKQKSEALEYSHNTKEVILSQADLGEVQSEAQRRELVSF